MSVSLRSSGAAARASSGEDIARSPPRQQLEDPLEILMIEIWNFHLASRAAPPADFDLCAEDALQFFFQHTLADIATFFAVAATFCGVSRPFYECFDVANAPILVHRLPRHLRDPAVIAEPEQCSRMPGRQVAIPQQLSYGHR